MNRYPNSFLAWCLLITLLLAMILSLIDRMVISLLVIPIQGELNISDTEMGWVLGVAFGLFYSVMGLPLGRMVDRYNRIHLIAMGIALWSVMTLTSGLSENFWQLFFSRMGVGIGEAILAPAAWSLLSDVFPPQKQARALSVFQLGALSGTGLGLLLGGWVLDMTMNSTLFDFEILSQFSPWRVVFLLAAMPGVVIILLILQFKEPRGAYRDSSQLRVQNSSAVFAFLREQRYLLPCLFVGMGAIILMIYSVTAWAPTMISRKFGIPIHEIGYDMGLAVLSCSVAGVLFGGWITDYMVGKGNRTIYVRLLVISALGVIPCICLLAFSESYPLVLLGVSLFFLMASLPNGVLVAYIQRVTPTSMRGIVGAAYVLTVNLIGYLLGPPGVALISEYVFDNDLGLAMATLGVSLGMLATVIFLSYSTRAAEFISE